MEKTMEKIVALCNNRGFIYPGSQIYGGLANTWDYGNLGVELKNNVKKAWWQKFVTETPENVGVDCAILMNPKTWVASGHLAGFSDPLMDCKACGARFRADQLIEGYAAEKEMTLDGSGNCVITQVNMLGPAYEAGVTAGMIIRSVDGKSISGMTLDQISSLVRGEPGTKAVLQLESNGALQTMEIERKNIKAQTVTYQMLDNKIGYIAISQFSGETWLEFRTAKLNLIADGMEKLIVDVRDNGGGVMGDALNIAGMLIPQGKPLVFYEQQGEIIDEEYSAGGTYKDVPLVVLINDHTASASECLAAAVKDNGAGTLVGVTTYGKGVAQELVTLDNGDSFKLTFCHFLTPNKQRIDKVGIAPDIAISNGSALTQEQIAKYLESVLPMDEGKKYFKGQRGLNVLAAQQRLNILGYKVPQNAVMEAATMDALKRIQALYGASPYGGLDFCTIELVDRAFYEFLYGDGTDKQLQKAIEVLQ